MKEIIGVSKALKYRDETFWNSPLHYEYVVICDGESYKRYAYLSSVRALIGEGIKCFLCPNYKEVIAACVAEILFGNRPLIIPYGRGFRMLSYEEFVNEKR